MIKEILICIKKFLLSKMVRKCKKYISLWDRIYKEKLSSLFCSYLKLFYIFLIYRWRTRSFYIWIMVLYISYVGDTLHLCIYFIYMLWKWYTEFLYVLSLSDIFDPLLNKKGFSDFSEPLLPCTASYQLLIAVGFNWGWWAMSLMFMLVQCRLVEFG